LSWSVPVFACSAHGTAAGNEVSAWVNGPGSDNAGINADGFKVQGKEEGDGKTNKGKDGWNAHDWYSVTVTFPDGSKKTITANPANFSGGGEVEDWLESEAKKIIMNAAPPDKAMADFVG
jgi:hypothetical protein